MIWRHVCRFDIATEVMGRSPPPARMPQTSNVGLEHGVRMDTAGWDAVYTTQGLTPPVHNEWTLYAYSA